MRFVFFIMMMAVSGCIPLESGRTAIAACPPAGLADVVFYTGSPAQGVVLAPDETSGIKRWNVGSVAGNAYLQCVYDDGNEVVQRLPSTFIACDFTPAEAAAAPTLACDVRR